MIDVKLVRDLHTTNIDQLHAYLRQHEFHANESQQYSHNQSSTPFSITYPSNEFQSFIYHNVYSQSSSIPQVKYAHLVNQQPKFSQPDSDLIVPVFQKGDDPIDAINYMMSFLIDVVTFWYPTTNNQLRNSSNQRQQATINNGRVTLQPIQERQTYFAIGTSRTYTSGASGNNYGKQRLLSVTTAKRKATCPNSALNQRGKEMINGLRIKCCWITTTAKVPFRKPIALKSNTPKPVVVIFHETSAARSPQQNGVVERRNCMLIEASRTMLIYARAPLFLWAEAVATACYSHSRSIIRLPNDSENLGSYNQRLTLISSLAMHPQRKHFGFTTDIPKQIIKTIHVDFDELTMMASEQSSSRIALHEMTPATISLGLVQNLTSSTPFVPPVDLPAPEVIASITKVVAPEPAESTGSPSSTTVDQNASSPSNSQTTLETQSSVIPNDLEEDNHDIEVAHMGNDSYFGIPIPEVPSDQSSSSDVIHTIMHLDHQISEHNSKCTKDHPLENIIGELVRPVSTRLQLHVQALFTYYDAFLTFVEPKTYKDALTQS
nr:retrovirus-related Pol polyprotein from transposon TNT 1-94 [Tanacetum cinerariifolium]